jgi:small conductance mechanosensitive channel
MAVTVIVIILFYFLAKGFSKVVKWVILRKVKEQSIKDIIDQIVFAVVFIIGFFFALVGMDLDKVFTSVLAGAGLVGLVGLALHGTLSTTVSGFI